MDGGVGSIDSRARARGSQREGWIGWSELSRSGDNSLFAARREGHARWMVRAQRSALSV